MPKKITSESQKKVTALQQQSKSISVAAVPTNHSTNSIISEMHI